MTMTLTESHRPGVSGAYGYTLSGWVETDDEGTAETIGAMSALAIEAATHDPATRAVASAIVADADRRDWAGVAQAVYKFVRKSVKFKRDVPGHEVLRHPEQMVLEIAGSGKTTGDCDESATLGAALLLAAGIPAAFITIGRNVNGPYAHVLYAAKVGGDWVPIDSQEGRYGYVPAHAVRRQLWEIKP